MFGFFHRLKRKRLLARAQRDELAGALEQAVGGYLKAQAPDEAARVLLLQADAESSLPRRLSLCAQAARVAPGTERGQAAQQRKALLSYDLLVADGGQPPRSEMLNIARELERCQAFGRAAEAYARAGDEEGEIRALENAGDIGRLERRLQRSSSEQRAARVRKQLIESIRDLDAVAERRQALERGRKWLQRTDLGAADDDARTAVVLEIDRIANRLLGGPHITLQIEGSAVNYLLGTRVTVGRADADLVVHASAISRQHLRLYRQDGQAFVEDLATRNGTTLAGARIGGALAVGAGLDLRLAGQVPLRVTPTEPDGPLELEVAGQRTLLPLGPLRLFGWEISDAHDGDDRFVVVRTPAGHTPPFIGAYRLAAQVELCRGDQLATERRGSPVVIVPDRQPDAEGP